MGSLSALDSSIVWLAIGLGLIAFETVAAGIFLFWLGLAALATGLVLFLLPLGLLPQVLLFSLFGLGTVFIGYRLQKASRAAPSAPHLNDRVASLRGQNFKLETGIEQGFGSVRIGDTVWRVAGPDLPVGAMVTVMGSDGGTLKVEAA